MTILHDNNALTEELILIFPFKCSVGNYTQNTCVVCILSLRTCRFGPLVRAWTMRFEARHKYFKRLAVQLGNFINIVFSLAMRHQRLQCYHQLSNTLEGEELEIGPGTMIAAQAVEGLAPISSTRVFR